MRMISRLRNGTRSAGQSDTYLPQLACRDVERGAAVYQLGSVPWIAGRSGNGFVASIAEALCALIAVIDTE